jgi:DNA-binding transcriptional ArsR family regulator
MELSKPQAATGLAFPLWSKEPLLAKQMWRRSCSSSYGGDALGTGTDKQVDRKSPTERAAHLLQHWIRVEALTILIERVASPSQIASELGVSLQVVVFHMDALVKGDAIELVEEKKRGPVNEHFYRATRRPEISHEEWLKLSLVHKQELAVMGVRNLFAEALASVNSGKMLDDPEMYWWWKAASLDPEGRQEVRAEQDAHVARLLEIEARSNARAVESRGALEQEPAVLAVMGFDRARRKPVDEIASEDP